MLQILYRGIPFNGAIDPTDLTGDIDTDRHLAYIESLLGGKIVAINDDGFIVPADGDPTNGLAPLGFLVDNAAGNYLENAPALASQKVAIMVGAQVVITDQINTDLTFKAGEKLYCGTDSKIGLVTNVPASGARQIGIAGSSASAAAPELTIIVTW